MGARVFDPHPQLPCLLGLSFAPILSPFFLDFYTSDLLTPPFL